MPCPRRSGPAAPRQKREDHATSSAPSCWPAVWRGRAPDSSSRGRVHTDGEGHLDRTATSRCEASIAGSATTAVARAGPAKGAGPRAAHTHSALPRARASTVYLPGTVEMARRPFVGYTSRAPAHTTRGIRLNKKSRTRLLVATGVIVAVFIVGVVFLVQKQGAYYRQVSDLHHRAVRRQERQGRRQGARRHDQARRAPACTSPSRTSPARPDTVKVLYSGQMPNTFDAGVDVVVIGKYASNGALITADQLQTKCPSKYKGSGLTRSPDDRAVRSDACDRPRYILSRCHAHLRPGRSSAARPRLPGLSARTSSATATTPSTASS